MPPTFSTAPSLTSVKLDSQAGTPPSLTHSPTTSDRGRESTVECTPVATPVASVATLNRPRKEPNLYFSWHRKQAHDSQATGDFVEEDILFPDTSDSTFPLFPDSPPDVGRPRVMASAVSPIDITSPPRYSSPSPRNQTSNLTNALQGAGPYDVPGSGIDIGGTRSGNDGRLNVTGRNGSVSNGFGSYYGTGARPIAMRQRSRRESNTAGSFMNKMSWGGTSVGSFIRDE